MVREEAGGELVEEHVTAIPRSQHIKMLSPVCNSGVPLSTAGDHAGDRHLSAEAMTKGDEAQYDLRVVVKYLTELVRRISRAVADVTMRA